MPKQFTSVQCQFITLHNRPELLYTNYYMEVDVERQSKPPFDSVTPPHRSSDHIRAECDPVNL